jgi:glycosyltransferase involved in cell wall biosynthesis
MDEKSFAMLKEKGFNNIVNIPNPIPTELEEKARELKKVEFKNKKNSVIFIGHVIAFKGVFELVEACSFLKDVNLLLIGPVEDEIKNKLICLAKNRNNGEWLSFTGNLNKEGVLNYLVDATVLVLPSYTEGFPYVVLEAMSMGCSVIGTNVGAIPEMLSITSDKPCGMCVEIKNVVQLSEAINKLISDMDLSKKMGNNGLDRVLEKYTIREVIKLYENIWFKVLSENKLI